MEHQNIDAFISLTKADRGQKELLEVVNGVAIYKIITKTKKGRFNWAVGMDNEEGAIYLYVYKKLAQSNPGLVEQVEAVVKKMAGVDPQNFQDAGEYDSESLREAPVLRQIQQIPRRMESSPLTVRLMYADYRDSLSSRKGRTLTPDAISKRGEFLFVLGDEVRKFLPYNQQPAYTFVVLAETKEGERSSASIVLIPNGYDLDNVSEQSTGFQQSSWARLPDETLSRKKYSQQIFPDVRLTPGGQRATVTMVTSVTPDPPLDKTQMATRFEKKVEFILVRVRR